jgi:TolB-like protein
MSKLVPHMHQPAGKSSAFEASEAIPPGMRHEAVQRHLEKVVVSAEMCRSKKLCQFLRFTVEEVLRGHGSELKEYAIAVGVFKRGREFDPAADPIVRVQARRLRSKLARYYQSEGLGEPLRIEYPVGGYSPVFTRRSSPDAPARPALAPLQTAGRTAERRIAVLPFIDIGPDDSQSFNDGLTDDLIHALSNWLGVRVVARGSCFQFKGKSDDMRRIGEWLAVSIVVSGSVRKEGSRLRILMQLVDAETGLNLWSASYERELEGILDTQQKISQELCEILKTQFAVLDRSSDELGAQLPVAG